LARHEGGISNKLKEIKTSIPPMEVPLHPHLGMK